MTDRERGTEVDTAARARASAGVDRTQAPQGDQERASVTEVVVGVTEEIGAIPGVVQVGKFVADKVVGKVGSTGGAHKAEKSD